MAEMGTEQEVPAEDAGVSQAGEVAETAAAGTEPTEGTEAASTEQAQQDNEKQIADAEKKDQTDAGVKREIKKLRDEKRRLNEQLAYERGRNDGLSSLGKTAQQTPDPNAYKVPEPKYEDFSDPVDFNKAYIRWDGDRREFERGVPAQKEQATTFSQKVASQREAGEEKYEDFEAVVPKVAAKPEVFQKMIDTGVGHEILYAIGKDPALLAKFNSMSVVDQAIEIAGIAAKVGATTPPKQTTNATPPPKTVKAGTRIDDNSIYTDQNMSSESRIRANLAKKGLV